MIARRSLLAASAALLTVPVARPGARAEGDSYIVGTLFPMAGPNAEYGTIFTAGAQMALTHIAEDKLLTKPVELRAEDSQGTPQGGATGMTKLASVDHATYTLVGFTGVSKAAAPIALRNGIVMVNGGGVGPDLAGLSPLFWNVLPLIDKEIAAILPWMATKGFKRIALIYVDDPLGNAVVAQLKAGLPGHGAELVGSFPAAPSAQQFGPIAAKIRDANPDAIYFASYGAQQAQIIKQLRDNGIALPLITYSAATIPSVRDLPQAEGLVFTTQVSDWNATDPVTARFVKDWRAKYQVDPTIYNQNYYNCVRLFALLVQGVEKAGKPVNGAALREELLRVRRFALVGGEGVFDDQGDITLPIQIDQMKSGKAEKVG